MKYEVSEIYFTKLKKNVRINSFDKSMYYLCKWCERKYTNIMILSPRKKWKLIFNGGRYKYSFDDLMAVQIGSSGKNGFFSYDSLIDKNKYINQMKAMSFEKNKSDDIIQEINFNKTIASTYRQLFFQIREGKRYYSDYKLDKVKKISSDFMKNNKKEYLIFPMIFNNIFMKYSIAIISKNNKTINFIYNDIITLDKSITAFNIVKAKHYLLEIFPGFEFKYYIVKDIIHHNINLGYYIMFIYLIIELISEEKIDVKDIKYLNEKKINIIFTRLTNKLNSFSKLENIHIFSFLLQNFNKELKEKTELQQISLVGGEINNIL